MTRPRTRLATLVLGAAVATAAFAPEMAFAQAKPEITIDLVNEPSSLDPHGQWNPDSYYVYRNVFDNVVTRDNEGNVVPEIATEWTRLSDTEVEFTLRDDITFHDGEPLTAEDVVYSIERITDPEFGSPQLGQFDKITGAEATGDHTVVLTTDGPYPVLLAQLVKLSVVPKHVVEEVGAEAFNLNPVGSGPYRFEEWQRGVSVTLSRYDDYWGEKGPFETAVFRAVPDASTRMADLQAGTADLVVTLDSDQARQLETSPGVKPLIVQTERVAFLGLNTTKPPFDDPQARKAVALAIDKEGIVEGLLAGGEQVVGELASPAHFGWVDGIEAYPYDPEQAKELIEQAGAGGTEIRFATSPVFDQRIVQAVQQMLSEVGLNVSIDLTDMATYLQKAQGPLADRPQISFGRWSCACQDADGIMYPLLHSSSNWSRYQNTEMDALLEEGRSSLDEATRLAAYEKAHRIVRDDVAILPLYQAAIIYGARDGLQWTPTANESLFLNRMSWQGE
ncbi:ABC transporter substrate-binding protein [Lutibaculum baratangense]|uniref:Oligopeptide ABC transporter, periplasmic oligopeptide-binding protein OppA n=1 Tax=Lutibaculum baratangense AMV1 TaxID=631454 RepID=V4RKI0_9HYPH|nr:ABC transporter substrate-binding protein [Lutibaculum baratangense]ESR23765.1 Oligopeptide ABC transporter, periplasmic oligopeptide-binding protein OppA [Lutibaculum baratangense AMV1]